MKTLVLAVALFLTVPALRAQQAESKDNPPQAAPQQATQDSNAQNSLPDAFKPGHPLDPADVDILTGKRDREIEASRRAAVPIMVGGYGGYGDLYGMNGRRGEMLNFPQLPLTRINNPFFFFSMPPRGLGARGFGRR